MGAALSVSNSVATNNTVLETVQTAENTCGASCSNIISGVNIILDGSTTGDINFTQRCEADASCMMKNALDQVVQSYQLAEASAEATLPILPIGFQASFANAITNNDVEAAVKQVLENHCSAAVDNTIQDVLIYATNSTTGNIGFEQGGNAQARCVMDNAGRMKLSLEQRGVATATSGWSIGGIVAIVIAIVIMTIVIAMIRAAGKKGKQDGGDCPPGSSPDPKGGTDQQGMPRCVDENGNPVARGGRSTASRSARLRQEVGQWQQMYAGSRGGGPAKK